MEIPQFEINSVDIKSSLAIDVAYTLYGIVEEHVGTLLHPYEL